MDLPVWWAVLSAGLALLALGYLLLPKKTASVKAIFEGKV